VPEDRSIACSVELQRLCQVKLPGWAAQKNYSTCAEAVKSEVPSKALKSSVTYSKIGS
jgi:hypothetical protein